MEDIKFMGRIHYRTSVGLLSESYRDYAGIEERIATGICDHKEVRLLINRG